MITNGKHLHYLTVKRFGKQIILEIFLFKIIFPRKEQKLKLKKMKEYLMTKIIVM